MKWSLLVLLPILWNYGTCQETEGPEATIDLYEGIGSNPADIVFLLDTSTSNDVDLYNKIRSFLVHFVESSSVESGEVRFAFVQYSNYPDVKFYLNKYSKKADIITAIRDATFNYGERNTADAFDLLRRQVFTETNGDRPQIPNVVLLVTTGTSDRNSYRTIQEAEALRFAGVGIFVIGIGLTNTRELEEMASRPTRENTFQLGSADELESVRDIAFAQIFTRAEHAFRSPVSGSEQLDLMFLLHFSNNMRKEGLNLVLDFIQNLLEYADIDSGRVRVGISIYRKLATGLYNLDRFSTKAELMEGIKQITTQYKAKAANTAAGLDFVRTDMFVQKAGDRPNVPNAVIIITDANTNINQADAITAAEAVKAAGTAIVSIGIGLENPDELDALATSRDFSLALTQASELNSNIIYLQDRINALKTLADLPSSFPSTTPPSLTTTTTTAHAVVMTIQPPSSVEILGPSVTPPLSGSEKADIVFAVHLSDTATARGVQSVLNYLNSLISGSDVENGRVQIGLLIYSADAEVIFNINQYRSVPLIRNEILRIATRERSKKVDASAALSVGTQMLDFTYSGRMDAPKALIFVTDRASTENAELIPFERFRVESGQVNVFSVGIGLSGKEELEDLATAPENVLTVSSYSELPATIDDIKRKIFAFRTRDEKTVPEPEKPETTKPELPIRTLAPPRQEGMGITLVPRNPCAEAQVDFVYILDASTSVTQVNFKKMLDFCKQLLAQAEIDNGNVQVGVVVYSTDVKIEFHLNRYKTKSDVLDAVDKIKYIYGSTNTAGGLKTMREEMFSFRNGDRPDVPNVAIILTDGVSNINARRTVPEAEQARAEGIHIYAIGIGLTDTRELNAIASSPASENSFSVKTFDDLKAVEEKVFTSLCPVIRGKQRTTVTKKIATDRTESTSIKVATIQKTSVATTRATTRRPTPIKPTTPKPTPTTTRPTTIKPTTQKPTTPKPTPTTTKSTTLKITTPKPTTPKPTSTTTKSTTPKPTTPRPTTLRPTPATTKSTTKPATPKPTTPKPTPTTTKLTTTQPTTQKPTTPKPTSTTTKSTTPQPTTQKPTTPKPTSTTTKSTTPKSTTPKPTTPKPTSTTTKSTTPAARRDGYDLVMVLDSSVNSTTFNWMMDIARSTIQEISIDDEEWRVGILTYSTSPNREFHLNQYKKKADVLRQLDRVYYRPGQTNTAAALKYARTNMFRESNGDRDFAKNYLMLITGNEKSVDMYAAANEAYQMQRDGVGTYVIGLGINDRTELDELASLPLADYEVIIPAPNQIRETPGQIIYNMRSRSPTPNPPPTRPLRITTTSRPVRPDPLLACKSTGDIVFILDSSGSVGLENFFRVLNFTFNTVDELDMESGNYRVGLVTFSDSARIEFYLNAYTKREEVKNALEKVRYVYGSTHTAAALRRARLELFRAEAGDRQDVPNVVVTITDGNSNVNNEMTLVEADLLKRAGVSLITVAVGFQRQTRELVGLTSAPVEENLIYVDDYKSLDKLSQKLVEPLCTDSDLCRNNPCRNDAVCVDGIRSYMCLCPESYYGSNCEKQCSEPADVAFILDSSNTVGERNFQIMKDYAGSLIQEMNVEACDINIGLMKYSSAPMMQWGLGMHRDTDTNLRAVNQVQYTRGVANMAAALKALRTDIFNGRGGDRPKAKNIAYLLTDGSNMVHEEDTQKNAELAISSGIRIIPVGVSLRDREEVDLIAGAQNLNTIIIDEALGEINEAALAPMVKATDYCAGNPCKNAAKCVNEPYGFTCDCLAGFTGDDCSRRCSAGGDVVFAVDTSRYVTRKEMKHVRRFLRSVVKRLRFKEFKTGLVQYSNTANVILTFADGDKKKNVLSAIAGLRNMPGDPDPAEALAKANFRIFKGDGAMKGEPDYLVLLSKGLKKEEELLTQSNKLKMKGTRILGVGIGLTSSEKELMESVVSYPTSDTVYYADDVERLDDVADKVVEFMCNGQDKCAQNPCQNKGKCHAIGAEYYCDCPLGFAGKNCELKCDAKADIVFLLDSSGSVGHVDFRKVKDFAYRMIDDLNIGKEHTRVGLVAYSSRSRHGFYLKDYYEKYQLQNAISSIGFEYGKTNTADGLRHVREKLFNSLQGDRPDAQNFVVVITDGLSNIKSDQTLVEADLLKANGVHVYAIGIGKFDRYEIDRIASAPASQNAFILEDYASLGTISSDIIRATCKDPSVCDENPCRNDGKCEPTINGPVCKCAGGYRGKYCDMSCVSKKDIIFVLDSSASVGEENFELTLEFVSSVVEELSRGDSDNRYALITFSNDVQLVFSLGRYPSAGIILNAIKYTRYRPGSTNTAGGLRTVLEISSPEYGDRKDVDNIVMLVADGQSNVNAQDTIPAAEDLKKTGAKIVTIGVGLSNYQELEGIASGSDNVYKVNTYNLLDDVKADILESSCSGNG